MKKKFLTLTLVLVTALALTAVAHADVVAGPVLTGIAFLPWILVGAAVGATVYLLQKFWKKKK